MRRAYHCHLAEKLAKYYPLQEALLADGVEVAFPCLQVGKVLVRLWPVEVNEE